jgi:hypothetical protein
VLELFSCRRNNSLAKGPRPKAGAPFWAKSLRARPNSMILLVFAALQQFSYLWLTFSFNMWLNISI